jgi:tRNA(Ile)-lysidine synthetase-like protein
MGDLLARVRRYAERYELLPAGETVVVGVSGGPDSLALLHLLLRLSPELRLALHVAHLNHGLRGAASQEDAVFVADLAERWGLACTVGHSDVRSAAAGRSLEEAARLARYRFLADVAAHAGGADCGRAPGDSGARIIAVGHNADDQAETVLMHFLRGTGVAGLRGMLPRHALSEYRLVGAQEAGDDSSPWLVRPLLAISRRDIEGYCADHGLEPRFDRSNEDLTIYRNRLRHELLPLLGRYNPGIRRVLVRTGEVMAGDGEILRAALDAAWREVAVPSSGPGEVLLDRARWRTLPLGLQRATLREAVRLLRHGLRNINWEHVERAVWLAREGNTGQSATLAGGLMLGIGYDSLRIAGQETERSLDVPAVEQETELNAPGTTHLACGWSVAVRLVSGSLPERPGPERRDRDSRPTAGETWEARLDAEWVGARLVLRPRRPGDRFQPQGLAGHSVELHEFMINQKVPREARTAWPLLEGRLGLAWICGLRVDERARVTAASRRAWHVRFEREPEDAPGAGVPA